MRVDTSTAEALFKTLLAPLYPEGALAELATIRATDANPAGNAQLVAKLAETAEVFTHMAPRFVGDGLSLDLSDASVHRLSHAMTRERRDAMLRQPGPEGVPVLAYFVIHGAAYVGECVVRQHGGVWQVRSPLWESLVRLTSRAGEGDLATLSWWLRSLCDGEIDRGTLADRYRMHVEVPCARPEELPIIAPADRRLPRLKKPRYDVFHRYLKAHLPELRDLGADFPSAERFAELDFGFLEVLLVGDGRMALVWGPSSQGVHLFWLDVSGFTKGAYYPADAFPDPVVRCEGDKVQVIVSLLGKQVVHEVLWWGP